jgi:ABC-2 type transport system permease protein
MMATMAARCARLTSRQTDSLITSLTLPVMLMVTFVYLFGGAINVGTRYVTYVVPGVLVLCAVVGSATTAVTVCQDMTGGIIDRFLSMDVGAVPLLAGHVAASVVRNVVSWLLALGVALAIGFRPHASAAAWLAAVGVLLAFVLAISWLAAALGLLVSSPEAANGTIFGFMFITYTSSAFVQVKTMPWWLHGFANDQPVTPVIETVRALLLGAPAGSHAVVAVAWCAGIALVSVLASTALWRRRVSR